MGPFVLPPVGCVVLGVASENLVGSVDVGILITSSRGPKSLFFSVDVCFGVDKFLCFSKVAGFIFTAAEGTSAWEASPGFALFADFILCGWLVFETFAGGS